MTKNKDIESRKTFVLDTNVIIHDPEAILSFKDNEVIIPIQVIEELDSLKKGHGEIPYSARQALKIIDSFRDQGKIGNGIFFPRGGSIRVDPTKSNGKKVFKKQSVDNDVISLALFMKNKGMKKVVVISKDAAVRIKAEALGVVAQDYWKDKTTVFQKYGRILEEGVLSDGIFSVRYQIFNSNVWRVFGENNFQETRERSVFEIFPKNMDQMCAIDALTCPSIQIVALTGNAGSGKTLLALASGLHQTTKKDPLYEQVLVTRPIVPLGGNDLGFLPGDIEEKLKPWMQPIFDNLEVIVKTPKHLKDRIDASKYKSYQYLIEGGIVQIEALSYIRGRTLPKRYFIVDEAQNLRPLDIKTIITRCGEGTKIVFTGDLGQIDAPYLDAQSNGLAYLISRYIKEPEFCYLHLSKSARSSMADKASRLL